MIDWRWYAYAMALGALTCALPQHHRRSMLGPTTHPLSKGGWRPVMGSGLPSYGNFGAAPLHAQYKMPVPVMDNFASSSRPLSIRDAAKMTSIAQSYRPTTLRNSPAAPSAPNQPISSYLNPFSLPQGLSHYKIVQNYPKESVIIRNPHIQFNRPFPKNPTKYKQTLYEAMMHQLGNVQPVQFGAYKPHEVFAKPVEVYARPTESKKPKDPNALEVFKPEVYELPDSAASPQSVQQVKTAQQVYNAPTSLLSPYHQYPSKDEKFGSLPSSILGTFSSYGVQSMKGRDPLFPTTKTTYLPPAPTKQTIFNSFSFTPTFKTTPYQYPATTPKLKQPINHISFGTANDFKHQSIQQINTNSFNTYSNKVTFKPSPQDPFHKAPQFHFGNKLPNDINKLVSTHTTVPTTTVVSYFNDHSSIKLPPQLNSPINTFYQQHYDYQTKRPVQEHPVINQGNKYSTAPNKIQIEATPNSVPFRATYEVTEIYDSDALTKASVHSWMPDKNLEPPHTDVNVHSTTLLPADLPEELAIVTETNEKGYENSLNYDKNVESQSRPLNDNEPIGKHKLKDYYYKVSTPVYEENKQKRPAETATKSIDSNWEYTTHYNSQKDDAENDKEEALPTLAPNKHFRRPSAQEPVDKDKIRKRNKNRRRRPQNGNHHRDEETSTKRLIQPSTESPTTLDDEVHTFRPRIRPTTFSKPKLTTPSVTTDLSTSALPPTPPTIPTIVKTKIGNRRPVTTPLDKLEATTISYKGEDDESPIMRISNRPQQSRGTTSHEYKTDTPNYSHKQDEKDTPTSDVAVIPDRNKYESQKTFSFHKDLKPLEAVTEAYTFDQDYITMKRYDQPKNDGTERLNKTEDTTEIITTPRVDNSSPPPKMQRPKLKNKYEQNRPRFSVKDYRNRLSSTTTTEKSPEQHTTKLRFPQRRQPFNENKFNSDNDNATEARKKFTPKDPRHKPSNTEEKTEQQPIEKEHQTRTYQRQRIHIESTTEVPQKVSSRIRKRPKPTEELETSTPAHVRRIIRKKIKDSAIGESVNDITVTETTVHYDSLDASSERTRSESAIMKIAKDDKKHHFDSFDRVFEHSKRVSDLTLAASKDYNTPGMFKTVSPTSRRIPNYFTIATDDPILPIEAFFPQLNQKRES